MKHLKVSAAILINNNQILCTQRGQSKYVYISKKFEFPGGKIEPGETALDALIREIDEELEYKLNPCEIMEYLTIEHTYPDFSITMYSFLCTVKSRDIVKTEHLQHIWLDQKEIMKLDWAAADIPLVRKLMKEKLPCRK